MEKRDWLFILAFVISFFGLMYFIGGSVTGYMVKTSFCDEDGCKEICRFDYDCTSKGEVCCKQREYGICETPSNCKSMFSQKPELDSDIKAEFNKPGIEEPAFLGTEVFVYAILATIILMLTAIYFNQKKWI